MYRVLLFIIPFIQIGTSCTIPVTCSNILDLKSLVIIPFAWNPNISRVENTRSLYRLLAGFAFHFGEKSILCRIFPHMSVSISQSSATKDMTPLLPVTFHGAESPWTLVPVSTIWFAMVRIRLYLTGDVISRFNRHRFKTSPLFDPLGSLELLHLLWQCLWMSGFMKIQGYFNDNSAAVTKEDGRAGLLALVLLHHRHFLPDRLTATEFLSMVKSWEQLYVCNSAVLLICEHDMPENIASPWQQQTWG